MVTDDVTTTNELGAEIESVSGEVPRRPILVVEYPVGMSMFGEDWIENALVARRVIEAFEREGTNETGCGLAIPVEIDMDGRVVKSWSILKSPGWSVYELQPPDTSQTKEEGIT